MKEIKRRELELLVNTCKKHNLPFKMVNTLLKTAEKNTYENKPSSIRKKELLDLIEFFSKERKGD